MANVIANYCINASALLRSVIYIDLYTLPHLLLTKQHQLLPHAIRSLPIQPYVRTAVRERVRTYTTVRTFPPIRLHSSLHSVASSGKNLPIQYTIYHHAVASCFGNRSNRSWRVSKRSLFVDLLVRLVSLRNDSTCQVPCFKWPILLLSSAKCLRNTILIVWSSEPPGW